MVKLKFGSGAGASSPPPPPERPAPPERAPSLKLSFKSKTTPASTPTTEHPPVLEAPPPTEAKPKRKYTKKVKADADGEAGASEITPKSAKKRARRDDDGEDGAGSVKKTKPSQRAGSITLKIPGPAATATPSGPPMKPPRIKIPNSKPSSALKLSFSANPVKVLSATTPRLKVKALGKKPIRPIGVGYDSEDEEAEDDPAIESQFILRMQPGEDCEYLRKAIADSAIKHRSEDKQVMGPNVWMRFFDKEGRRGVVCVRGHLYAATLLDLPCIIEGMKSWDKKGWFKTADICQMLLVLGRVQNDDEAKHFPLPREIDTQNWQYPHGLTPPMHWVRKRRFRKRVNVRTIERVENDVEELLRKDKEYLADKGSVSFEWVDPDAESADEEEDYGFQRDNSRAQYDSEGGDLDADGDADMNTPENEAGDEEEDDELTRMMMEELEAGGEEHAEAAVQTAGGGLLHASPDSLVPPEVAFTPASGGTTSVTEGESQDEGGSDDDGDEGGDEDEDAKAERQERQQQLEEIEDLKNDIAQAEAKRAKQHNALLKQRVTREIEILQRDLDLKLSSLGMSAED